MISLDKLQNDWESLAKRDALGAILTDPSRTNGGWNLNEFMHTGQDEIETVMCHLASVGCTPAFDGAALDFGCGVGRLTQSLARRFASCVGVDISPHMIQNAELLNQYAHCSYLVHSDLRLPFADATFSFIYSNIVLQHMPSQFAEQYLREFVRILAPGAILVFGVQDSFAAPNMASRLIRICHFLHIRSRIKDALGIGEASMQMHWMPEHIVRRALGSARVADIQFTNTAAKDFNGKLVYLPNAPASGYIGKQYCVVKPA